jgi:hypothetical protein
MKEYKYTINGNKYEVVVGDIKDNIATLTVNGETYTVEMEKQPEPEKKKPVVKAPAAAAVTAAARPSSSRHSFFFDFNIFLPPCRIHFVYYNTFGPKSK